MVVVNYFSSSALACIPDLKLCIVTPYIPGIRPCNNCYLIVNFDAGVLITNKERLAAVISLLCENSFSSD